MRSATWSAPRRCSTRRSRRATRTSSTSTIRADLPARGRSARDVAVQLANDAFRETLKLRPQFTEAGVEWADLFLEKYAAQLAEQTLEEVFKVNPNDPEAHGAMAQVIVETRYDLAAVRHHLDAALAAKPEERPGRSASADRSRSTRTSGTRRTRRSTRCSRSTRTTSRRSR